MSTREFENSDDDSAPQHPAAPAESGGLVFPFWLSAQSSRLTSRRELATRAAHELARQTGETPAQGLKALVDRAEDRVRTGKSISPWVSLKASANLVLNPQKRHRKTEQKATELDEELDG